MQNMVKSEKIQAHSLFCLTNMKIHITLLKYVGHIMETLS